MVDNVDARDLTNYRDRTNYAESPWKASAQATSSRTIQPRRKIQLEATR